MAEHSVHKSRGKTLHIGICAYLSMMFETNEISDLKLTDKQILKRIEQEYPGRTIIEEIKRKRRSINERRGLYNAGQFTKGIPPEKRSFRYEKFRLPGGVHKFLRVEGSLAQRPLTPDEIEYYETEHASRRKTTLEDMEQGMADKAWKQFERRIAAFFGTERTALSGGNSKITRSDTLHPKLFIEAKLSKALTSTFRLYDETAVLAKKEKKIPVLAIQRPHTKNCLIICHKNDFEAVAREYLETLDGN